MPLLDASLIRTKKCADSFNRICIGFLFFFGLRIGMEGVSCSIEILPDFIGWTLIAFALNSIVGLHSDIRRIRALACGLAVISLFDLVGFRIPIHRTASRTLTLDPSLIVETVARLLSMVVVWRLCRVIMDMAAAVHDPVVWNRAELRRKLYIGLYFGAAALITLAAAFVPTEPLALFGVALVAVLPNFLMMGLMRRTAKMCAGAAISGSETLAEGGAPSRS